MNGIMYPHNSFSVIHNVYFVCKMEVFADEFLITF